MKIFRKDSILITILQIFGIIALALVLATVLLLQNAAVVTQALNQQAYKLINNEGGEDNVYFKPDYKTMADLQKDETIFAEQVRRRAASSCRTKIFPSKRAAR